MSLFGVAGRVSGANQTHKRTNFGLLRSRPSSKGSFFVYLSFKYTMIVTTRVLTVNLHCVFTLVCCFWQAQQQLLSNNDVV
jgi:hypothetical protein